MEDSVSEEIETRGAYGFTSWDDLFLRYYWDYILIPLTYYKGSRYELLRTAFYNFESYLLPYLNREQKKDHEEQINQLFKDLDENLSSLTVTERAKQETKRQKWLFITWNNKVQELLVKTGKSGKVSVIDKPRIRK